MFFAASRDQRQYFSALSEQLAKKGDIESDVVWYRALIRPRFLIKYPVRRLWREASLLTIRKQNSRKGKHYPDFVWPVFTGFNFLQACWLYAIYSAWLTTISAQAIGVWNGKKFRQAILGLAAEVMQKKTIFFETGPLPGMSAIDSKGVNFYSSIPSNLDFYLNRSLSATAKETTENDEVIRPSHLPKQFVLVPFQVVEDSNIYLHSHWIRHMRQLFDLCKSMSEKLDRKITFVFKEHPACDEQYDDLRHQQTPNLRFIDDFSTSELVGFADAIITVNSTVGIEGLMARKKVFVLGDALFGIDGISYVANSEKKLLHYLKHLEQLELNETAIVSFIDYLKNDYAIPENAMKEPGDQHWQAANRRLSLLLEGNDDQALSIKNKG